MPKPALTPFPSTQPQLWLYVEDNDSDVALVQRILKKQYPSVHLTAANSTQAALALLRQPDFWPDLILLDLHLAGLEGFSVLREVRSLPAHSATPIVVFSSFDQPETVQECYRLGASSFVVKPASYDQLTKKVQSIAEYWCRIATPPQPEPPRDEPPPAAPLDFAVLHRLFTDWVIAEGDFDALDQLYTREARILPPGAPAITGREAVRGFWRQLVSALHFQSAALKTKESERLGEGVVEVGEATLSTQQAASPMLIQYVVVWKQEAGAWKRDLEIWNLVA